MSSSSIILIILQHHLRTCFCGPPFLCVCVWCVHVGCVCVCVYMWVVCVCVWEEWDDSSKTVYRINLTLCFKRPVIEASSLWHGNMVIIIANSALILSGAISLQLLYKKVVDFGSTQISDLMK